MPGAAYVNAWPSRVAPVKSTVPLPSRSSWMTLPDAGVGKSANVTTSGTRPTSGNGRSAMAAGVGVPLTDTVIEWLVCWPAAVWAVAFTVVTDAAMSARTRNVVPTTAPGTPLTVTVTSAPPAGTVPRMTIGPAGTTAPSPGSVIVTVRAGPTVKARDAGLASSLPARSRALTAKTCGLSARPEKVALVSALKGDQGPLSRRQEKTRLGPAVWLSEPLKLNVAFPAGIRTLGPAALKVSGGGLVGTSNRGAIPGF